MKGTLFISRNDQLKNEEEGEHENDSPSILRNLAIEPDYVQEGDQVEIHESGSEQNSSQIGVFIEDYEDAM